MAMLQRIHQIKDGSRASSLYCQWIRESRRPGAPLVAVWIDSEMRVFEHQWAPATDEMLQDALDEPGGAPLVFIREWALAGGSVAYRQ